MSTRHLTITFLRPPTKKWLLRLLRVASNPPEEKFMDLSIRASCSKPSMLTLSSLPATSHQTLGYLFRHLDSPVALILKQVLVLSIWKCYVRARQMPRIIQPPATPFNLLINHTSTLTYLSATTNV